MYKAPTTCSTIRPPRAYHPFTRSLSENLVGDGIQVNAVAWSDLDSLNPYGGQPPEKIEDFGENTPMGRPGQPNEVAPPSFSSPARIRYMSGQLLHPNGGIITGS